MGVVTASSGLPDRNGQGWFIQGSIDRQSGLSVPNTSCLGPRIDRLRDMVDRRFRKGDMTQGRHGYPATAEQ